MARKTKGKRMDKTKVVIDNWPKTNRITVWIPIIVAMFSLIVSIVAAICSYNFAKKSFVDSHRPYVWAVNVNDKDTQEFLPECARFRISNAPARIWRHKMEIRLRGHSLHQMPTKENFVRFPDSAEGTVWGYDIPTENFKKIVEDAEDPSQLERVVSFDYSSLNGGRRYHYELKQKFIFTTPNSRWETASEASD